MATSQLLGPPAVLPRTRRCVIRIVWLWSHWVETQKTIRKRTNYLFWGILPVFKGRAITEDAAPQNPPSHLWTNRFKSTFFNVSTRSVENTALGSIGKPRIVLEILGDQEKAAPHTSTRLTRTEEIRRERRHASSRARRGQPLFFLAAQVRKLSFSASLEWTEEALKRHARDSDGDAATEVLSFPSVF